VEGEIVKIGKTIDLLQEAQKEYIMEFTPENEVEPLKEPIRKTFPGIHVYILDHFHLRISSPEKIDLMPFMKFFAEGKYLVREARIIRPSLEEVFVKVTGLEIDRLKKEKGGEKK